MYRTGGGGRIFSCGVESRHGNREKAKKEGTKKGRRHRKNLTKQKGEGTKRLTKKKGEGGGGGRRMNHLPPFPFHWDHPLES
jgi:hypothetical protein